MNPRTVKTRAIAEAAGSAGLPLCMPAEEAAWKRKFDALDKNWRAKKIEYRDYSAQREALETAQLRETVERARGRAEEYLAGLLIIVGNRGNKALRFYEVFTLAHESALRSDFAEANTAENRRLLHALLKTISEIPDNWSDLDLRRFLLGIGEQGKAKYKFPGRGMFKNNTEWAESEVSVVCECLVGEKSLYAEVLRLHISKPFPKAAPKPPAPDASADYEIVPVNRGYAREEETQRKPVDKEFLSKLVSMLEQAGLR